MQTRRYPKQISNIMRANLHMEPPAKPFMMLIIKWIIKDSLIRKEL